MQITRHWRLNSLRYRLQGVRYENGRVSLQARPLPLNSGERTQANGNHASQRPEAAVVATV